MEKAPDGAEMGDVGFVDAERLREIRDQVDWQALFFGLGLEKAERSTETDWWAISPFLRQDRPSFHLRIDGLWYDFGIKQGGGVIELVQRFHGVNCFEAGRIILDNGWTRRGSTGLTSESTPTSEPTGHEPVEGGQSNEPPVQLRQNPAIRQDLLPFLKEQGTHTAFQERGISEATCQALGIGFLGKGRSRLSDTVVFALDGLTLDQPPKVARISHFGWRPDREPGSDPSKDPPWVFYEGFDPSLKLYNLDQLFCRLEAEQQVRDTEKLLLVADPWDVAKCWEAGIYNVCSPLNLLRDVEFTPEQGHRLRQARDRLGAAVFQVWFQRDADSGQNQAEALSWLSANGLEGKAFDWERSFEPKRPSTPITIPESIQSPCDMTVEQLRWLRRQALI